MSGLSKNVSGGGNIELSAALHELKEWTSVTMETVGIRCQKRVNTSVYKKGLAQLKGEVMVQPPNEDRVSVFTSLQGGKQASIKLFSTGKIRCLKSDFKSLDHALQCAQGIIDEMASLSNSGMPRIKLSDAKLHTNNKDFTWSTRQSIVMRQLVPSLQKAGIRAESDTSFGDSVMVIINPNGSERQIKGQVLADGTIRLAGCRGDGPEAGRAVVGSLNDTGCLQGGKVDLASLQIEVWLTKRHFDVCEEGGLVNIDALQGILSAKNFASEHPQLASWALKFADKGYKCVQSLSKVGSASPRLEIKFLPVVINEWEQVKRKPEPVSICVHHKGEVQLAGNAEYKVLQGYWFIKHLFSRHATLLLFSSPSPKSKSAGGTSRAPKRKLEVVVVSEPPSSPADNKSAPLATPPTRRVGRASASRVSKPAPMPPLSHPSSSSSPSSSAPTDVSGSPGDKLVSSALNLFQLQPASAEASVYHMQQMLYLSIMRQHCTFLDAMKCAEQQQWPMPEAGAAAPSASTTAMDEERAGDEDEVMAEHGSEESADAVSQDEPSSSSSSSSARPAAPGADSGNSEQTPRHPRPHHATSVTPLHQRPHHATSVWPHHATSATSVFATPALPAPAMGEEGSNSPIETPPSLSQPLSTSEGLPVYQDRQGAMSPTAFHFLSSEGGRNTPLSPLKDASRQKTAESPGPRMAISKMLSNVVCEFSDPSNKKARLAPASLDVPIPPLVFRLPDV